MICDNYSELDFKSLFPHSKYKYDDNGKLIEIDVNLNKAIISDIKVGIAGDQIKIIFKNNNGTDCFCPENWVIKLPNGYDRFSEDYIKMTCDSSIYNCIYFFFEDVNKLNERLDNCPKFICSKEQIEQYVSNIAHGIIVRFDKLNLPYDFSFK